MRNWSARFGVVLFAVLFGAIPARSQELTRTANLAPLRLTYGNLTAVINQSHKFLMVSNASSKSEPETENMTVTGTLTSLRLREDFSPKAFADAPPVAYSVTYQYQCPAAAVSSVEITLGDYDREVTVAGNSPDQVQALLAILTESLGRYETHLGGPLFRALGAILLGALVFSASVFLGLRFGRPGPTSYVFSGLATLAPIAALLLIPWAKWAPGTAVYVDDASFLVRNSATIGLVGTIASVLSLGLTFFKLFQFRSRVTSSPE